MNHLDDNPLSQNDLEYESQFSFAAGAIGAAKVFANFCLTQATCYLVALRHVENKNLFKNCAFNLKTHVALGFVTSFIVDKSASIVTDYNLDCLASKIVGESCSD